MTIPSPREIVTPEGRIAWLNPYSGTYTTSREYALRMQRGFARGLTQEQAQGRFTSPEGLTPYQRRLAQRGELPAYYMRQAQASARRELGDYWPYIRRKYITPINRRAWKNAPRNMRLDQYGQRNDPRMFASDIVEMKHKFEQGYRDPYHPEITTWQEWIEYRLSNRLNAIIEFQDNHNAEPGRSQFNAERRAPALWLNVNMMGAVNAPPIEFWYYH